MSAIFGIIDFNGGQPREGWIKSMQGSLSHRGPDGSGLFCDGQAMLGHMSLHVTQESVFDRSPLEEDDFVITADARLDEREALMDWLEIELTERERITDTQLLLKAYLKSGREFVKNIYGDFAFAIWDKKRKELFCARDQMGIKPFLYYYRDGIFVFSTELSAIVRLPFVDATLNDNYLLDIALGIAESSSKTCRKEIDRLMPAYWMAVSGSKPDISHYWRPHYKRDRSFKTQEMSAEALREVLERVIKDHTRATGNVGVPLSGGLDSGTIACLASCLLKEQGRRVVTASSVYDPESADTGDTDESEFINEIIQSGSSIDPVFIKDSQLSFYNGLIDKFLIHSSPVNGYWYVEDKLFSTLHQKSVRRVLSGYMGDLTVSNSIINPFLNLFTHCRFRALTKLIRQTSSVTGQTGAGIFRSKVLYELLPDVLKKKWFSQGGNNKSGKWSIAELPLNLAPKERRRLQRRVYKTYSTPVNLFGDLTNSLWITDNDSLGEEWDCAASHHMLEMTYPLIDRRIVELLLKIPVEHFYAGGMRRGLIRLAMQGILPDKVRLRTSKGFYSPGYTKIIRRDLKEVINLIEKNQPEMAISGMIDWEKLKKIAEKQLDIKNMNSFVFENWVIVDMIIAVFFKLQTGKRK